MGTATKEAKATRGKAKDAPTPAPPPRPMTKGEIIHVVSLAAGITKIEARAALQALEEMAVAQLGKQGPREFTIPGVVRLKTVRKAATKAKQGRNPFDGSTITIAARPARNAIKAKAVKSLADAVS